VKNLKKSQKVPDIKIKASKNFNFNILKGSKNNEELKQSEESNALKILSLS
jgi:hypothetical protein